LRKPKISARVKRWGVKKVINNLEKKVPGKNPERFKKNIFRRS